MKQSMRPNVRFWNSKSTGQVLAYCPDIPGAAACGKDFDAALKRLRERLDVLNGIRPPKTWVRHPLAESRA